MEAISRSTLPDCRNCTRLDGCTWISVASAPRSRASWRASSGFQPMKRWLEGSIEPVGPPLSSTPMVTDLLALILSSVASAWALAAHSAAAAAKARVKKGGEEGETVERISEGGQGAKKAREISAGMPIVRAARCCSNEVFRAWVCVSLIWESASAGRRVAVALLGFRAAPSRSRPHAGTAGPVAGCPPSQQAAQAICSRKQA